LRVDGEYREWAERAFEEFPVAEMPLSFEVVRTVETLSLPHGDPADHFLAATALVYDLTLVTIDRNLVDAVQVPTLTR
jgi:PIN domain nuclease of toxin-antitoxin system